MSNSRDIINILVVDDSDVIRNSLIHFFDGYNVSVATCADGLEGIQKAVELKPDLIFLDLMMPNLDGLKMLQVKKVIKDIEDIPVVVISANTARRNVLAATEAGAEKIISKPLSKQVIYNSVKELLGEDIFKYSPNKTKISSKDSDDIKYKLIEIFLNSYPEKKKLLNDAVKKKDIESLRTMIHELKGTGGTMGYPQITEICKEIYEKEFKSATDWVFVEFKLNELSQLVLEIGRNFKKQLR